MLDKSTVAIVVILIMRRRHPAHAVAASRHFSISLGGFLCDSVTGIDPVGIHVDGRAEIVDVGLECLAAHLALEIADTRLLLDGDADRLLVVAEETLEGGGQLLLLQGH